MVNLLRRLIALLLSGVVLFSGGAAIATQESGAERTRPGPITISGLLEHEPDLEGSHLAVDGWALLSDAQATLKRLVGTHVTVEGTPFDGFSFLMRRQIEVSAVRTTLEGTPELVTEFGTPHYELHGWVLEDEDGLLRGLEHSRVEVSGKVLTDVSVLMRPAIAVERAAARDQRPMLVMIRGRIVPDDVPAVLDDGHLLLPLRSIVEAGGGQVTWDPVTRSIEVRLGDRFTTVKVGEASLPGDELLPKAPVIRDGRTVVPLKTFVALGLKPQWVMGILSLD